MDAIYFESVDKEGKVTAKMIAPQYTNKISFSYAESIDKRTISLQEIPAMMVQDKISLFIGSMI
jgi:hypothetical protein